MADVKSHETDSTDTDLVLYQRVIEEHQDHPVVKNWFFQITLCQLVVPGGSATFLMIEFRDGPFGAMVWNDGNGNWGTGGWRALSRGKQMKIAIDYLQGAPAARTFAEALAMVSAARNEAVAKLRPWWRFWG